MHHGGQHSTAVPEPVRQVAQLLVATLDTDPAVRNAGERALQECTTQAGFGLALAQAALCKVTTIYHCMMRPVST